MQISTTIKYCIFLFTTVLLACKENSSSDTEAKYRIWKHWSGDISSKISGKTIIVTLKNSSAFNDTTVPAEFISSSMALSYFKSWNNDEKNKYSVVMTILIDEKGKKTKTEYLFPTSDLKYIVKNEKHFEICADMLQHHEYLQLADKFDTTFLNGASKAEIAQQIENMTRKVEDSSGEITGYTLLAFKIDKDRKLVRYSGVLYTGKNGGSYLSIDVFSEPKLNDKFLHKLYFHP